MFIINQDRQFVCNVTLGCVYLITVDEENNIISVCVKDQDI